MSNQRDLDALREQLDTIDTQLFEAIAARTRVVAQIGALKAGDGRAIFDRDRERVVLERHLKLGEAAGVSPQVAQALSRVVLESSHAKQAEEISVSEEVKAFLLVGGLGGMGQLLQRELEARGHAVDCVDRVDQHRLQSAVQRADIVVVCVPMAVAVEVACEVAPWMRPDALLCDINSLKLEICESMGRLANCEVLGLHPMFGPSVSSLLRQKVVACEVKAGPLGAWLCRELGQMGAEVVETDPLTHDRMMAVVQVLVHFNTMVTGEALRRSGARIEETLSFTSPIYRLELAFIGRLYAQSPELYAEILMRNPASGEMRRHFLDASIAVHETVEKGDREAFVQLFRAAGVSFSDFGQEAMRISDDLIERLVSRA